MTDQQTAADNALVEQLMDGDDITSRHEAAERIKSLLAEVSDLKLDVATQNSAIRLRKRRAERDEADRQRMRDALEPFVRSLAWVDLEHDLPVRIANDDTASGWDLTAEEIVAAREAYSLNPASKEANDEPEL